MLLNVGTPFCRKILCSHDRFSCETNDTLRTIAFIQTKNEVAMYNEDDNLCIVHNSVCITVYCN